MLTEFDIRRMLEMISAIPMARLRILQSFDEVHLSEMRRGIIFVFAAWIAPSVMAFRRFANAIKPLATRSLDLVVLDTECLTGDSARQLFGAPGFTTGGSGETIRVRDGRIIMRVLAPITPETLLEQYTRE